MILSHPPAKRLSGQLQPFRHGLVGGQGVHQVGPPVSYTSLRTVRSHPIRGRRTRTLVGIDRSNLTRCCGRITLASLMALFKGVISGR